MKRCGSFRVGATSVGRHRSTVVCMDSNDDDRSFGTPYTPPPTSSNRGRTLNLHLEFSRELLKNNQQPTTSIPETGRNATPFGTSTCDSISVSTKAGWYEGFSVISEALTNQSASAKPTIAHLNTLLTLTARKELWRQFNALQHFIDSSHTETFRIRRDSGTQQVLLFAALKRENWEDALAVLEISRKQMIPATGPTVAMAMKAYVAAGPNMWLRALRNFTNWRHLVKNDATVLENMLDLLICAARYDTALRLFSLCRTTMPTTQGSLESVQFAAKNLGAWETALSLAGLAVQEELPPQIVTSLAGSALATALAAGMHEQVINSMMNIESHYPEVLGREALIAAAHSTLAINSYNHALAVLAACTKHLSRVPAEVYSCIMVLSERAGAPDQQQRVFEAIMTHGLDKDDGSHHALLANSGNWYRALSMYERIRQPDALAVTLVLHTAASARKWSQALSILSSVISNDEVRQQGSAQRKQVFAGDPSFNHMTLAEHPTKASRGSGRMTSLAYEFAASALVDHPLLSSAILRLAQANNAKLTSETSRHLIHAAEKTSDWRLASQIVEEMQQNVLLDVGDFVDSCMTLHQMTQGSTALIIESLLGCENDAKGKLKALSLVNVGLSRAISVLKALDFERDCTTSGETFNELCSFSNDLLVLAQEKNAVASLLSLKLLHAQFGTIRTGISVSSHSIMSAKPDLTRLGKSLVEAGAWLLAHKATLPNDVIAPQVLMTIFSLMAHLSDVIVNRDNVVLRLFSVMRDYLTSPSALCIVAENAAKLGLHEEASQVCGIALANAGVKELRLCLTSAVNVALHSDNPALANQVLGLIEREHRWATDELGAHALQTLLDLLWRRCSKPEAVRSTFFHQVKLLPSQLNMKHLSRFVEVSGETAQFEADITCLPLTVPSNSAEEILKVCIDHKRLRVASRTLRTLRNEGLPVSSSLLQRFISVAVADQTMDPTLAVNCLKEALSDPTWAEREAVWTHVSVSDNHTTDLITPEQTRQLVDNVGRWDFDSMVVRFDCAAWLLQQPCIVEHLGAQHIAQCVAIVIANPGSDEAEAFALCLRSLKYLQNALLELPPLLNKLVNRSKDFLGNLCAVVMRVEYELPNKLARLCSSMTTVPTFRLRPEELEACAHLLRLAQYDANEATKLIMHSLSKIKRKLPTCKLLIAKAAERHLPVEAAVPLMRVYFGGLQPSDIEKDVKEFIVKAFKTLNPEFFDALFVATKQSVGDEIARRALVFACTSCSWRILVDERCDHAFADVVQRHLNTTELRYSCLLLSARIPQLFDTSKLHIKIPLSPRGTEGTLSSPSTEQLKSLYKLEEYGTVVSLLKNSASHQCTVCVEYQGPFSAHQAAIDIRKAVGHEHKLLAFAESGPVSMMLVGRNVGKLRKIHLNAHLHWLDSRKVVAEFTSAQEMRQAVNSLSQHSDLEVKHQGPFVIPSKIPNFSEVHRDLVKSVFASYEKDGRPRTPIFSYLQKVALNIQSPEAILEALSNDVKTAISPGKVVLEAAGSVVGSTDPNKYEAIGSILSIVVAQQLHLTPAEAVKLVAIVASSLRNASANGMSQQHLNHLRTLLQALFVVGSGIEEWYSDKALVDELVHCVCTSRGNLSWRPLWSFIKASELPWAEEYVALFLIAIPSICPAESREIVDVLAHRLPLDQRNLLLQVQGQLKTCGQPSTVVEFVRWALSLGVSADNLQHITSPAHVQETQSAYDMHSHRPLAATHLQRTNSTFNVSKTLIGDTQQVDWELGLAHLHPFLRSGKSLTARNVPPVVTSTISRMSPWHIALSLIGNINTSKVPRASIDEQQFIHDVLVSSREHHVVPQGTLRDERRQRRNLPVSWHVAAQCFAMSTRGHVQGVVPSSSPVGQFTENGTPVALRLKFTQEIMRHTATEWETTLKLYTFYRNQQYPTVEPNVYLSSLRSLNIAKRPQAATRLMKQLIKESQGDGSEKLARLPKGAVQPLLNAYFKCHPDPTDYLSVMNVLGGK